MFSRLIDSTDSVSYFYQMHQLFDDPTVLYNKTTFLDYALRGLTEFQNQQVDPMVSNELWNELFQ